MERRLAPIFLYFFRIAEREVSKQPFQWKAGSSLLLSPGIPWEYLSITLDLYKPSWALWGKHQKKDPYPNPSLFGDARYPDWIQALYARTSLACTFDSNAKPIQRASSAHNPYIRPNFRLIRSEEQCRCPWKEECWEKGSFKPPFLHFHTSKMLLTCREYQTFTCGSLKTAQQITLSL